MYRSAVFPDRRLSESLADLGRRLGAVELRVNWPGAVQQSSVEVNEVNFVTPSSTFTPTYAEVTSLDLDPGRWILLAQVSHQITGNGTPSIPDVWGVLYLRLNRGLDERVVSDVIVYADDGSYFQAAQQVTAMEVTGTETSTASLQVAATATPPSDIEYFIYTATLLAFPG